MRLSGSVLVCLVVAVGCGKARTKSPPQWPEQIEQDDDCDGTVDFCEMLVETDEGIRSGIDLGCDGTLDEGCLLSRIEDRTVVTNISDSDCDGTPDGPLCFRTDNMADGYSMYRADEGCDGVWERCTDFAPRRGNQESWTMDEGCDGSADTCITVTHSAGSYRRTETDEGCDGTIEELACGVREPTVDDGVARSSVDDDCDGTADTFCTEKTYMHGVEVAEHRDNECDGVPDVCRSGFMSATGALVSGFDSDCDGLPESGCFGYTFDANQVTGQFGDVGCDGEPDQGCLVIEYDSAGVWVGRSFDSDCDGTPDSCSAAIY